MLAKPMRQLSGVMGMMQKGLAAAQDIFAQIDQPLERDEGTHEVERVKGRIEVRNLNFRYRDDLPYVLQDINFVVEPGKTVALVGSSGSGKSTLVSLLARFYDYHEGAILFDDVDIRDYKLANLRAQIALVNQQVVLFNDTVHRNIAYGVLQHASREAVEKAAELAYAKEFIQRLQHGFDTVVGDNGVTLSGGQRQRVAIARALLKDSPILILDEATSALDNESERAIQLALEKVMQNRTTLVIAHRLSTIENADLILVMEHGRIVESGDHPSLLQRGGRYAQLHQRQFSE
jgi:subfamily B ATP-binding cassette protein MsbA